MAIAYESITGESWIVWERPERETRVHITHVTRHTRERFLDYITKVNGRIIDAYWRAYEAHLLAEQINYGLTD